MLLALAGCAGGGGGQQSSPVTAQAAAPFACSDAAFLRDRSAFASGAARGDRLEQICGRVSAVRARRRTRSGAHGYFSVQIPGGEPVEVVANLDAMAEAATDAPPARWPWVAAGQYVYVQGRYYYDSDGRQGVDWTEDDTSRSWPHVGYVAVCAADRTACTKYW
jgi:hypothetical protein